jgi:arylsulfatase A-like enzyme
MKSRITTIILTLTAGLWTAASIAGESNKPNILLIVADDLGYGELSIQGNPQIPTPNIDSLAKSGIRFTSGYVSGPYCSPTRAGLQTGRYQQRFGHEFNPGPAEASSPNFGLSVSEKTIGDRLKSAGYVTGWFGKSHLGYQPQYHPLKRGYDEYFGFLGGAHDYLDAAGDSHNPILRGTNRVNVIGYTTEDFGNEAVQFIRKHKAEPWFVYLPFNAVHAPLEAPDKYLQRFPNVEDRKRHVFAGMLSALDDAVGHVLNTVREQGQEENTLIFFISDNGGPTGQTTSSNGPLRGFKAQTWEGGIRVPYIIQWKNHLPAGKVDDRPVIQLDILPTALAAAGEQIRPEWKLDGVNLLPFLDGHRQDLPHSTLYWRFGGQIAIRKGDWKLVKAPGLEAGPQALAGKASTDGAELYNLTQDIGEKSNLAAAQPQKVRELAREWDTWNAELAEPAWRPQRQPGGKRGQSLPQVSNAPTNGPWKAGDTLSPADAPRIANHALAVTAEIDPATPNGVIVAQGGPAHGYTLYLQDGKLAFGVRVSRQLTVVTSNRPIPKGKTRVEAQLAADGRITLLASGTKVAEGQAPGLIAAQPARGLSVGSDLGTIGDYTGPNTLRGTIEQVTVKSP